MLWPKTAQLTAGTCSPEAAAAAAVFSTHSYSVDRASERTTASEFRLQTNLTKTQFWFILPETSQSVFPTGRECSMQQHAAAAADLLTKHAAAGAAAA